MFGNYIRREIKKFDYIYGKLLNKLGVVKKQFNVKIQSISTQMNSVVSIG